MSWRERDEGARAFERGQSRWGNNPHDDGYSADYDERQRHREWEDGHTEAERREERRAEEAEAEMRERYRQDEVFRQNQEEEEQKYLARLQEQEELEQQEALAEQCATERGEG